MTNKKLYEFIDNYLFKIRMTLSTDKFAFTTYNAPNTMFEISNDLPEIMLNMSPPALKLMLTILKEMKRNYDPTVSVTVLLGYKHYSSILCKTAYYNATKELKKLGFIISTPKQTIGIINPKMANKLFKPKFEE